MRIPYNASKEEIADIYNSINGALLIGGSADLPQSAIWLYDMIIEGSERGDYFPLWGTVSFGENSALYKKIDKIEIFF